MEFHKTKRALKHLAKLLPFNFLVPTLSLYPLGVLAATTHCSPEIIIHGVITKNQERFAVSGKKNIISFLELFYLSFLVSCHLLPPTRKWNIFE